MKRVISGMVIIMFMLVLPMMAAASNCCPTKKADGEQVAMSHGDGHGSHMEHAKEAAHDMHKGHEGGHMEHAKDAAHDMHKGHAGGFATIGEESKDGVKGVAKIMTYDAEKAKMINATHHIMVYFTDEKTGGEITEGKVALKILGDDSEGKPMMLMQMGSGYGADLRLGEGDYNLEVGTKLADGKKRKFEYMMHNH